MMDRIGIMYSDLAILVMVIVEVGEFLQADNSAKNNIEQSREDFYTTATTTTTISTGRIGFAHTFLSSEMKPLTPFGDDHTTMMMNEEKQHHVLHSVVKNMVIPFSVRVSEESNSYAMNVNTDDPGTSSSVELQGELTAHDVFSSFTDNKMNKWTMSMIWLVGSYMLMLVFRGMDYWMAFRNGRTICGASHQYLLKNFVRFCILPWNTLGLICDPERNHSWVFLVYVYSLLFLHFCCPEGDDLRWPNEAYEYERRNRIPLKDFEFHKLLKRKQRVFQWSNVDKKFDKEKNLECTEINPDADEACCAICLQGFENGDVFRHPGCCSGTFHASCLDLWYLRNNTCPLCRAKHFEDCECVGVDGMIVI